jgi:hypothetical protein
MKGVGSLSYLAARPVHIIFTTTAGSFFAISIIVLLSLLQLLISMSQLGIPGRARVIANVGGRSATSHERVGSPSTQVCAAGQRY